MSELPQQDITAREISYHALVGRTSSQTIKFTCYHHKTSVQVLIDSGSTHNYVQESIGQDLSFALSPSLPFNVYIGNVDSLICENKCLQVSSSLLAHKFRVDLFVLPING